MCNVTNHGCMLTTMSKRESRPPRLSLLNILRTRTVFPRQMCPQCAEDVYADASVCRYCGYSFEDNETTQTTPTGHEMPVPRRDEFEDFVKKVAPPGGRKRPGETDPPREQSD
jgi:hypothetical protein